MPGRTVKLHIGNGDIDDEAASVVRIRIGLRMRRVVVILRIRQVDGDERHVAPIFTSLQIGRLCRAGLHALPRAGTAGGCRARRSRSG